MGTGVKEMPLKNVQSIGMAALMPSSAAAPQFGKLHISKTLTSIHQQSMLFFSVTEVTADADHPKWMALDNMVLSKDTTVLYFAACGNPDLTMRIPKSVQKIYMNAFRSCQGVVKFPAVIPFINDQTEQAYDDYRNINMARVIVQCGLLEAFQTEPYSANFSQVASLTEDLVFEVHVTAEGNGNVVITDTLNCNEVGLKAIPESEEYKFNGWSNGMTDEEIRIEVDDDVNLTAYFVPKSTTSLLSTKQEQKAIKIIEGGQIYILRAGKRFNLLGSEIK